MMLRLCLEAPVGRLCVRGFVVFRFFRGVAIWDCPELFLLSLSTFELS